MSSRSSQAMDRKRLGSLADAQLEPITVDTSEEAIRFLVGNPYENAYLLWLIAGKTKRPSRGCFLSRDETGAIDGICSLGTQIILSASSNHALTSFARHTSAMPSERMIIGPTTQVQRWWELVRSWHPPPRMTPRRQPIYVLQRFPGREDHSSKAPKILTSDPTNASKRFSHRYTGTATLEELDEIAREATAMIASEIGVVVSPRNPAFLERTTRLIQSGWYHRMRVKGELRFQCHIAAKTAQTVHIQGVWTPPALRGRGYATKALAAICEHLLATSPTVSLYVNDFNTNAVRLYERLGFRPVGEFLTMFF